MTSRTYFQSPIINTVGNSVKETSKNPKSQNDKNVQTFLIKTLNVGQYFGEIGLITNLKRTASVKAIDFCTLFCLPREDFALTKSDYPIVY